MSDVSGVAIASAPEDALPGATPPRSVRASLDLHGFTREQEMPWPPPSRWIMPISQRLFGAGIAMDDALGGNEETLAILSVTFIRHGTLPGGAQRYICNGCLLCRPGLLDSFVVKLATQTAKAVLYEQAERRRQDRAERAVERDARRRLRETAKKRPARRRRT